MKKITAINLIIICGNAALPLTLILFFLKSEKGWYQISFLVFMLAHIFERVWETFYTSKEKRRFEMHGDWTLIAVSVAYLILCFSVAGEFYLIGHSNRIAVLMTGVSLYVLAFLIRWWGMKSLGKQWAIHAVGAQKISHVRVIKIGAYKYVRHPIYLGVILEVISLPLIANAFHAFFVALLINVPLQILRAFIEERYCARRFDSSYQKYKQEVGMLIPYKYFLKKITGSKYVKC